MNEKDSNDEKKKKKSGFIESEIELQFHWYIFTFVLIYYGSYLISGSIFLLYFLLILIPYVMEVEQFLLIFTQIKPLIATISAPLVFIGCYVLRLILIGLITRWLWQITEKKSPTKDGVIPRNIPSKTLNYYHIRSFMIKYPKYVFTKGLFPWLSNWMYNYVGTNKIGKNTTIEEQVCADKYIDVGKNCYIGVNSVLTSHLVEGIFGNISYFEVKVGDNTTFGGMNNFASGCEIGADSYLMPWASGGKHYKVKGDHFYSGLPLRKMFKSKIKRQLKIPKEIVKVEQEYRHNPEMLDELKALVNEYNIDFHAKKEKEEEEKKNSKDNKIKEEKNEKSDKGEKAEHEKDLVLDFITSSAISKVSPKFLAIYIPIFFLGGLLALSYAYEFFGAKETIQANPSEWISTFFLLPLAILIIHVLFIIGCLIGAKLFLVLINLIHTPKEGVFKAEMGNPDFDFWCLRNEVRKLPLSLSHTFPVPYIDAWALRWLGMSMDFSSHLNDAWCDSEFIELGRKVMIGQGAVVMSSMVVGKYLFIKKVLLDDYVIVGGQDTISPGTIMGRDSVIGALSTTNYGQVLKDGWIYFGIPAIKLKENKYAESERDSIRIVEVDEDKKYDIKHDVNIDEEKEDLIKEENNNKEEDN